MRVAGLRQLAILLSLYAAIMLSRVLFPDPWIPVWLSLGAAVTAWVGVAHLSWTDRRGQREDNRVLRMLSRDRNGDRAPVD